MEISVQQLHPGAVPEPSGLSFGYALKEAKVALNAPGSLIIALRHAVKLKIGDQVIVIPPFASYYVAAVEKPRAQPRGGLLESARSAEPIHFIGTSHSHQPGSPLTSQTSKLALAEHMQVQSAGPWLAICASALTWRVLLERMRGFGGEQVPLYAGLWPKSRTLAAWALHTMRLARTQAYGTLEPLEVLAFAQHLNAAQAHLQALVQRCPGRNASQQQQVLRRLMRVRQCMHLQCADPINIEKLANLANYSRSHFMNVYRVVFGETPHRQLRERRMQHAQHMLTDLGLSVREATFAAGFEDRSSFSKLYHRYFGVTAQAAKRASVV
jgi:AraC-like DNA-binding protein